MCGAVARISALVGLSEWRDSGDGLPAIRDQPPQAAASEEGTSCRAFAPGLCRDRLDFDPLPALSAHIHAPP